MNDDAGLAAHASPAGAEGALALAAAGGPVVLILAALSVFALGIVLAKLVQFAGLGADLRAGGETLRLWRAQGAGPALAHARRGRGPVSAGAAAAIALRLDGAPEAAARDEGFRVAADGLEALRGWMRPLEVIGALAPLLGLFGTVLGMIDAFAALQAAGDRVDPGVLSGGIWEALLTTAVGLAVAIPAVAAHNAFDRRVERLEHACETVLTGLFAMAPASAPDRAPMATRPLHAAQ